jgi:hypothetical protein
MPDASCRRFSFPRRCYQDDAANGRRVRHPFYDNLAPHRHCELDYLVDRPRCGAVLRYLHWLNQSKAVGRLEEPDLSDDLSPAGRRAVRILGQSAA